MYANQTSADALDEYLKTQKERNRITVARHRARKKQLKQQQQQQQQEQQI